MRRTDWSLIIFYCNDDKLLLPLFDHIKKYGYEKTMSNGSANWLIGRNLDNSNGKPRFYRNKVRGASDIKREFQYVEEFDIPKDYNKLIGHFNRHFR